jgi:hypothetical protein
MWAENAQDPAEHLMKLGFEKDFLWKARNASERTQH